MKSVSNICLIIAVVLISIGSCLLFRNNEMEDTAETASNKAVARIYTEMQEQQDDEQTEVMVDGDLYIGVLNIPVLGLELPIQSSWSYEKLRLSPCFYQSEPLSIIAHNYKSHFGDIKNLNTGDVVTLTYVTGNVQEFEVVFVTKIKETDIEALADEQYDLTLLTCNYNDNTERVLVRLNVV